MTKSKKILLFILTIILCLLLMFMGGCNSKVDIYLPEEDSGYYISNYVVDIVVGKDKKLSVTESITAYFETGVSNGIYRYIPLTQTVGYYGNDGKLKEKNYSSSISNFSYNKNTTSIYQSFEENGYQFYALKRTENLVNKSYTFDFSYDYQMPDDRDSNIDFLYYNIIGTGWDTSIKNVDFTIEFPSDANISLNEPDFYVGRLGKNNNISSRVTYLIEDNTVKGNCKNLEYGEALTVYRGFEDGYFTNKSNIIWDIVILISAIVVFAVIITIYLTQKRKQPIVEVVEFKAPEDITPTEAGFLIDEKVTGDDISALVVYWASKGNVKIEQQGEETLITKLKDLPEKAKKYEKDFFAELFKSSLTINSKTMRNLDPQIGTKVKTSIENKEMLYFNTKSKKLSRFAIILAYLIIAISAVKTSIQSINFFSGIFKCFLISISFISSMCCMTVIRQKNKWKSSKFWTVLILSLIFSLAPLIVNMFIGEAYCDAFVSRIYLTILPILMIALYPLLEKYSEKGRKLIGHLLGLKNFILLAEKEKMEMLANENPSAFFDILPFAYVLGVSRVYMEKFKDVPLASPTWLTVNDVTSVWIVCSLMNKNISFLGSTLAKNMPSALRTFGKIASTSISTTGGSRGGRSGGGFSGGGFSGGGFGGGGGGRF